MRIGKHRTVLADFQQHARRSGQQRARGSRRLGNRYDRLVEQSLRFVLIGREQIHACLHCALERLRVAIRHEARAMRVCNLRDECVQVIPNAARDAAVERITKIVLDRLGR
jgi:hypothetical protein